MNARWMTCTIMALTMTVSLAQAKPAKSKEAEPVATPLTEVGNKLAAEYTATLEGLKAQIVAALPKTDAAQKSDFVKAYQAEALASAEELKTVRGVDKKKPETEQKHEEAVKALESAQAAATAPVKTVMTHVQPFLSSDKLDDKLVKFIVLAQATPHGLAEFAEQGTAEKALVDQLLSDNALMKQMVMAEGADSGKYGQAMKIYTEIEKTCPKSHEGLLQRLALAVALEHATPIKQANPKSATNAPEFVDPVKRYQGFEQAYLNNELDPNFKDLTIWDLRNVVNGDEPDETLAWGRQMLHNYRPDLISTPDTRWRYVQSVKTEVKYGSADQKYDREDLQGYQNMIMNGGVCGRRAFFGRFILRCFGIPTTARPQKGHATLVHWSPEGWVINLGAGWTWGWTKYGQDRDFLAYTQARMTGEPFEKVMRAKWVGQVEGEAPAFGFHADPSGFWNGVALYEQRQIVEESQAKTIAAVGTDIGEANESKEKETLVASTVTDADRKIEISSTGVITIPAVACSTPKESTPKIIFMPCSLGGMQLHYARLGVAEDFEYTFDAPAAGTYALTARVVTTSDKQTLTVAVNGGEPITIDVPFTVGMWDKTPAVEIKLNKGQNVLHFSRTGEVKGLTIKDFTLTPTKQPS
ncbi:MAG: hypothetical protein GC164_09360 [Phycisphaera sp.]|nr:hypothetical protein [Phycisphaera sp.]